MNTIEETTTKTDKKALDLLLGSYDREKFFDKYWEKRSLYLPHDDEDRFKDLVNLDYLKGEGAEGTMHLKGMFRDSRNWVSEMEIKPDQLKSAMAAQMTICFTMLAYDGARKVFIDSFKESINMANQPYFNCYYSPDKKGYGLHFDTHPVWILQVEGRKRWQIGLEPEIKNPPFNIAFPPDRDRLKLPWVTVDRPDMSTFTDVVLKPGDVLYIPAGTWHEACAQGSSLALTLAQTRVTPFDLFQLLLQQLVMKQQGLLTRIHGTAEESWKDGAPPEEIGQLFEDMLGKFRVSVDEITPQLLQNAYHTLANLPPDTARQIMLVTAQQQAQLQKQQAALMPPVA